MFPHEEILLASPFLQVKKKIQKWESVDMWKELKDILWADVDAYYIYHTIFVPVFISERGWISAFLSGQSMRPIPGHHLWKVPPQTSSCCNCRKLKLSHFTSGRWGQSRANRCCGWAAFQAARKVVFLNCVCFFRELFKVKGVVNVILYTNNHVTLMYTNTSMFFLSSQLMWQALELNH